MSLFIQKTNFPDDDNIYGASEDITGLLLLLKSESEVAINWFETNHMFANAAKFQAVAVHDKKNINENYT